MLLDAVASCCAKFETDQTFQPTTPNISFVLWSPKRSATMLDPFARFFQHCRGHLRWLRMDYKDLWVLFFPRCTTGPLLVGSCCIRLHTTVTANPHATTPNIFGATMLRVVAPVCTQPHVLWRTWTQDDDFVFLFPNFNTVLQNSAAEKFTNIWQTEHDGIWAKRLKQHEFTF